VLAAGAGAECQGDDADGHGVTEDVEVAADAHGCSWGAGPKR
jgi:hypothetical protein